MDVTLQRHCARYIYVVPDGLRELMSDISREVLRNQPEDLYTFIADYLDALLITRENARIAAKFVEHMCEAAETICEMLARTGMTREDADRTAGIIQTSFKMWSDRKGILKEDETTLIGRIIDEAGLPESHVQAAAVVIQHAFTSYKLRKQRQSELLSGVIDWRVAARSAIKLYRRTGVSPEEAARAANLIKAAYKGYYTRRAIRQLNEETGGTVESDEELVEEEASTSSSDDGDERKGKGVRIDYTSVVPHVDFGDDELISHDLTSLLEDDAAAEQKDALTRVFGETDKDEVAMRRYSKEAFIKGLLEEIAHKAAAYCEQIHEDGTSEKDSVTRRSVEQEIPETVLPSSMSLQQPVSQVQLQAELQEAKEEMEMLLQAKAAEQTGTIRTGSVMDQKMSMLIGEAPAKMKSSMATLSVSPSILTGASAARLPRESATAQPKPKVESVATLPTPSRSVSASKFARGSTTPQLKTDSGMVLPAIDESGDTEMPSSKTESAEALRQEGTSVAKLPKSLPTSKSKIGGSGSAVALPRTGPSAAKIPNERSLSQSKIGSGSALPRTGPNAARAPRESVTPQPKTQSDAALSPTGDTEGESATPLPTVKSGSAEAVTSPNEATEPAETE